MLNRAAHKYCIDPLKDYVAVQIATHHIKVENALEIFVLGNTYENEAMIQMAKYVIKLYAKN
jgi:hypothetical protein